MSDEIMNNGNNTTGGCESGSHGAACSSSPGPCGVKVRLNHKAREMHVSVTRAVAGVSVASFCGLLIGVMALSRSASHNGPQSARASAEAPTKVAPVKPVTPTAGKPSPAKPAQIAVPTPSKSAPLVTSTPNKSTAVATTSTPAPAAKSKDGRVIGQTYLVFGSFPNAAEAKTAVDNLKEEGVSCTVERSLPGWTRKGWYSVVGVKGFESTKDASYQKEVKALRAKELEPGAYKWRPSEGA